MNQPLNNDTQHARVLGYRCRECQHKGRQFPQGVCPACSSANITTLNKAANAASQGHRRRWSLVALVILWGYLGLELSKKMLGD